MYNYSTSKQKMYTVGGAINIPFNELFDLVPRVRRQKLTVKTTVLEREVKFEEMKREIIELYATATSQLNVLKLRAEALNWLICNTILQRRTLLTIRSIQETFLWKKKGSPPH